MLACLHCIMGLSPAVCLQPTTANTCAYNDHSRSDHQAIISPTSTAASPKVCWSLSCALLGGGQRAVGFWHAGCACLVEGGMGGKGALQKCRQKH